MRLEGYAYPPREAGVLHMSTGPAFQKKTKRENETVDVVVVLM